jgi:hypothetical protein
MTFFLKGEGQRFTTSMHEVFGSKRYSFTIQEKDEMMELVIKSATHGNYPVTISRTVVKYMRKDRSLRGTVMTECERLGFRLSIYQDGDELVIKDCLDIPELLGAIVQTISQECCSRRDEIEAMEDMAREQKMIERFKKENPDQWDEYIDSGRGRERPCMKV